MFFGITHLVSYDTDPRLPMRFRFIAVLRSPSHDFLLLSRIMLHPPMSKNVRLPICHWQIGDAVALGRDAFQCSPVDTFFEWN